MKERRSRDGKGRATTRALARSFSELIIRVFLHLGRSQVIRDQYMLNVVPHKSLLTLIIQEAASQAKFVHESGEITKSG